MAALMSCQATRRERGAAEIRWGRLPRGRLHPDGALDVEPAGREHPGVGRPLDVPDAVVAYEPETLKPREQLGDLPLIGDPGLAGDLAVAGAGAGADRHQHAHGPVGDAHVESVEWIVVRSVLSFFNLGGRARQLLL